MGVDKEWSTIDPEEPMAEDEYVGQYILKITDQEISDHDPEEEPEEEFDFQDALARYRDMKVELAFHLEQLKVLEKKIKEAARAHVKETGEVGDIVEIDGARIRVTRPYPKTTFTSQADALEWLAKHEEGKKYVTTKQVSAGIRLQVD